MIVDGDTSVLVKLFVVEEGSEQVRAMLQQAWALGTALLARAELGTAMTRAARSGSISGEEAKEARRSLAAVWPTWAHIAVDEALAARAEAVAWEYGLRGYDAVHLASALTWQDQLGRPITLATFDRDLWEAASQALLARWPEERP